MFNLAVLFLCILLCCTESVKADSVDNDYATKVETLFKDLTTYNSKVDIAREKMKSFKCETSGRKYAIGIINLYTQDSSFYSKLNTKMRNGYLDERTDIWRRAGDLINRGLDILGLTVHEKVYRGCKKVDNLPVAGQEYRFDQIISTSTDKATAAKFIECKKGFLFVIDNVYGVSVEKYSHLSGEREVIIKSTNVFNVTLGPVEEAHYSIFDLDGQTDVNCRKKRDTSDPTCVIRKPDASGVNKPGAENISMYTFLVVTILISYEWI